MQAIIHQRVRRMEDLIHDLLTFSKTIHAEVLASDSADLSAALVEATSVLGDRIGTAPVLPGHCRMTLGGPTIFT